jgi:hypothetical protein
MASLGLIGAALAASVGLIETLDNGAWTATEPAAPPGGTRLLLSSVSCGAAGSCVAVGEFGNLIETLANGTWTAINGPQPADANPAPPSGQGVNFNSVACASAGSCVIAGSIRVSGTARMRACSTTWPA